ncbi:TMEM165/GDT1 family protein [bacterium]|nr:TMEM165/GDT1 family protein [bacterium]
MNPGMLLAVFTTVFLAELGDKTQLATLLFATNSELSRWGVFIAAALALVASTAMAVLVGSIASHWCNRRMLSLVAGVGFIIIGIWNVTQGVKNTV